ncbi:MAG: hypothetical protein ACRC2B_11230 [Rubrivivax sp.]
MNPALRTILWVGAGLALATAALAIVVLWLAFGGTHGGIDIRINGQPLATPELPGWQDWQGWQAALGAGGALLGVLVLLLAVPVVLLIALALGALGGALGIAGVLLAVALVATLALSPLWLVLLLVWLMLRRKPAPAPTLQP